MTTTFHRFCSILYMAATPWGAFRSRAFCPPGLVDLHRFIWFGHSSLIFELLSGVSGLHLFFAGFNCVYWWCAIRSPHGMFYLKKFLSRLTCSVQTDTLSIKNRHIFSTEQSGDVLLGRLWNGDGTRPVELHELAGFAGISSVGRVTDRTWTLRARWDLGVRGVLSMRQTTRQLVLMEPCDQN